ncbi:MAG: energy transducer TonB [Prevotella sp.]|nr:energy transducer TonB [Prevotella sp.]
MLTSTLSSTAPMIPQKKKIAQILFYYNYNYYICNKIVCRGYTYYKSMLKENGVKGEILTMKRGKRICNTLKEVRMQVAKANDIKYAPTECRHEGDCSGSCPKCESEVRWLEQQLQLRRQLGKAVAVVGVSMGLTALTACGGKTTPPDPNSDSLSILSETAGFLDRVPDSMQTERHFTHTEKDPSFPGGQQALIKYLNDNIKYPEQAKKDSISGRVVVGFFVETDGSITEPKVVRSVHPLLDEEALRVVNLMPKWEPGSQNGTPARIKYNLPIIFKMEEPSSLPTDTPKDNRDMKTIMEISHFHL